MSLHMTNLKLILYSIVELVTLRRKKSPSGLKKNWNKAGRAKGKIKQATFPLVVVCVM